MDTIPENGPKHIAIILDGNRRWAKNNGLSVSQGHKAGAQNLRNLVDYAYLIGLSYLTVYAFSTENWKRNSKEVEYIMKLLYEFTQEEIKNNSDRDICIKVYGDRSKLSGKLNHNLDILNEQTKDRKRMVFGVCFNYGGRDELTRAMKTIATNVQLGKMTVEDITEQMISDNLYTKDIPDPDLLIRTSGDYRLSNFLPWQSTYSELYFTDNVYFPDFKEKQLEEAIVEYLRRNRRFGGN